MIENDNLVLKVINLKEQYFAEIEKNKIKIILISRL